VQIRQQFVTSNSRVFGGTNGCKTITIHETANFTPGANAAMHAKLQSNGNPGREASWHWQVDDKEAIQSFRHDQQCWHAGDGYGPGNFDSIAIELCVNPDSDWATTVRNAASLVRKILAEHRTITKIVQHNHWSEKNCPARLRSGYAGITWGDFLALTNTAPPILGSRTLKKGDWGEDVGDLQRRLNVLPSRLDRLVDDESYGPLTTQRVAEFQELSGMTVGTGVFDAVSYALLLKAESPPEPEPPLEPEPKKKPWWIPPLATGTTYIGAFKRMMTKTIEITVPTFEGLAKGFVAWVHDLYISNVRTFAPYLAAILLAWITPALRWLGIQPDEGALIAAGAGFLAWLWYVLARTFERQMKWPLLAKIGGYMLIIPKTPTYEAPTSR